MWFQVVPRCRTSILVQEVIINILASSLNVLWLNSEGKGLPRSRTRTCYDVHYRLYNGLLDDHKANRERVVSSPGQAEIFLEFFFHQLWKFIFVYLWAFSPQWTFIIHYIKTFESCFFSTKKFFWFFRFRDKKTFTFSLSTWILPSARRKIVKTLEKEFVEKFIAHLRLFFEKTNANYILWL